MQWLAEVCVRRPVFATVLSLVILVVGGAFYTQLGVDQFPKIDFPMVVVNTVLPGASPEDIEQDVSEKIEAAVNTIAGVDELRSVSSEGYSQVMIQFVLEKNADVAAQEVQQKVNTVLSDLPQGIEPPMVMKFDPDSVPVLFIALRAPHKTVQEITDVADRIVKRRLETVYGVGQAVLIGGRKRQINIELDPLQLRALGISPAEVAASVRAQNMVLPGGRVDASRDYLSVRVKGKMLSVDAFNALVIRETGGRPIRLNEVAKVTDGLEEASTSAMWNGQRTVLVALRKQSGTNTVQMVDAVRERMVDVQKELPSGYTLEVQRDGSAIIRTGASAVKEHLVLGAVLAALVVLFFLGNARSTVIAALAIPTSIIGTFALMKAKGYTLNTITLLALALAVGIVIDDAIVVLENIFKYVEEKGYDPRKAAVEGTREIGMAVLATTLSLIAVFLPIAFIAGIPGRFLSSFGVTMSFAIAVSLWVSFTLTPMLASRWLRSYDAHSMKKNRLQKWSDAFYRPIESWYMRILHASMKHRRWVMVFSVCALISVVPLGGVAKKGFLPVDDRAQFEVLVRLPEGRSLASAEVIGNRVARMVREMPEVTATLLTVGDDAVKTPHLARVFVKLQPPEKRKATQADIKNRVRERILPQLPEGLRVTVADVDEFGGGQPTARIQYVLAGPDLKMLEEATQRALKKIKALPGAVDVDSTLLGGKPELGVHINRDRAADLGVQVMDVAMSLQYMVAGQKVSTYSEGGEQYEVWLRAQEQYRSDDALLSLIPVPSRKAGVVTLADVTEVQPSTSPSAILRFQRERQITLMANAGPGASEGTVSESIKRILEAEAKALPPGFSVKPQGQTKMMKETGVSFVLGLLSAFVFMYLILAAQFESWLHPLTILISLPLTLPFAILSVILFDQALDIYSFLGIFVLFGVVKKNAILQIDHSNKLREKFQPALDNALALVKQSTLGLEKPLWDILKEVVSLEDISALVTKSQGKPELLRVLLQKEVRFHAVMQANKDRLRPILMTTCAFVAGMIPLVTARGIGSGFNRATAGVVVGGQSFSLLLTLVAVPVVYSYFDDIGLFFQRWMRRKKEAVLSTGLQEVVKP
jgi:HAE1 family hydrophobic/amphiphilic exporter-1